MKTLVLLLTLSTGGLAHADAHPSPTGTAARLLEERPAPPSLAGAVALVSTGSFLCLTGLGAQVLGLLLMFGPGSTYAGVGIALGVICIVPGVVLAAVGVALIAAALGRFRQHDAEDDARRAGPATTGRFEALTTVARF